MNKAYTRTNFQNAPSTATPLNAENLNKIDKAINDLDDRIIELYGYQEEAQEAAEQASASASTAAKAAETATADAEERVNTIIEGLEVYTKVEADNKFAPIIKQVATGSPILIKDNVGDNAYDFKAYGRSTQDGTPTPEKPIEIVNVAKGLTLEVKSIGKNLIPYPYSETTHSQSAIEWTDLGDGRVKANGTANALSQFYFTRDIGMELEPNTTYILSGCPSGGGTSTYNLRIIINFQASTTNIQYRDTGEGIVFTTPSDYIHSRVMIDVIAGATLTDVIFEPMVRRVEVKDSTYEPYKSSSISIPLSEPLRSVGDVKDEIACLDGVYGVIRRIASEVFDGSSDEKWFKSTAYTNTYGRNFSLAKGGSNSSIWSHFIDCNGSMTNGKKMDHATTTNGHKYACFEVETLEEWLEWLKSNPLTVQYILAEEVFEPFENQEIFNNIVTYKNVTYITSTDNAEMEVTYATDTKTYIDNKFVELQAAIVATGANV